VRLGAGTSYMCTKTIFKLQMFFLTHFNLARSFLLGSSLLYMIEGVKCIPLIEKQPSPGNLVNFQLMLYSFKKLRKI